MSVKPDGIKGFEGLSPGVRRSARRGHGQRREQQRAISILWTETVAVDRSRGSISDKEI